MTLCECGCGQEVKKGNRFIHGHNKSFLGKSHTKESRDKMSKSLSGRHLSEETKKKISEANLRNGNAPPPAWGRPVSEETRKKIGDAQRGEKNHNFGKVTSDETKKKISESKLGVDKSIETRKKMSESKIGEKSPNWKGGVTPHNKKIRQCLEMRLWRESVFKQDNWTCQKYKIRGGNVNAHHIEDFANNIDLRFDIDNGITLSEKAHREFHLRYGFRNNTKEQLKEFLAS